VAPEVLRKNYHGASCDMWSLGVIVFVLLAGHMPFDGSSTAAIAKTIKRGKFVMLPDRWSHISETAQDFVKRLLVLEPIDRMTAQEALAHPWVARQSGMSPKPPRNMFEAGDVAGAFLSFARATRFQQACMQMMAWILPTDQRRLLRGTFLKMDIAHVGVLRFSQLDHLLEENYDMSKLDREAICKAMEVLDIDQDGELHYSDFLAVMMAPRLKHRACDVVKEAFRRFDVEGLGYLTEEGLWQTLGEEVSQSELQDIFRLIDVDGDGKVDLEEFLAHLSEDLAASSSPVALSSQGQ